MLNQPQRNLSKTCYFTITVKSRLIMAKIKNKIEDQKNLLVFLKVVISDIRDAFGANHFIQ